MDLKVLIENIFFLKLTAPIPAIRIVLQNQLLIFKLDLTVEHKKYHFWKFERKNSQLLLKFVKGQLRHLKTTLNVLKF